MDNTQFQNFTFQKNNTVTVSMKPIEYGYVENLARQEYHDSRCVRSVLNCYAVVKLYFHLSRYYGFIPIHSAVFKSVGSANRYPDYLEFLRKNRMIETRNPVREKYVDRSGETRTKTVTPKRYRLSYMGYYGCSSIFFPVSRKPYQVSLVFPTEIYLSMKKKSEQTSFYSFIPEKTLTVLSINDMECYSVHLFHILVKGIAEGKINSIRTVIKHVKGIVLSCSKSYKSLKTNKEDVLMLLYHILDRITCTRKKKEITKQIADMYSVQDDENQCYTGSGNRIGQDSELSYYSDLTIDIDGLSECTSFRDLYSISHLNRVPVIDKSGKIYSVFTRIRRPIRKYIRYGGERLVEVSDVRCAHFAMLPVVFRYCNITVHDEEMGKFRELTQTEDLYADVVKGTDISRDAVKQIFQSFYSIRNEEQYLYAGIAKGEQRERRIVCDYFKRNFPSIYRAIMDFHTDHDYTLKSVANIVESNIMNPICDRLIVLGLHPFRLHDAVYMTESECRKIPFEITEEVYKAINAK